MTIDPARWLYSCPNGRGMSSEMRADWLKHVNQSQPKLTWFANAGWIDTTAQWRFRMGISVATRSVALARLEAKSGHKRRRKKKRRGDPYPIEKTRSGGGMKSKRKGGNFEKDVAKLWSAYYGCSVRRTPSSGAWATIGGDEWASSTAKGDLVFAVGKVPYHIECKKHEEWDLADLITGVRGINTTCTNSIEKWWAQCVRDCPKKKVPMLIFARNRSMVGNAKNVGIPPLVMMRREDLRQLEALSYTKKKRKKLGSMIQWSCDWIPQLQIANDDGVRIVFTLDDFFKYIRPPVKAPRWKAWKRNAG